VDASSDRPITITHVMAGTHHLPTRLAPGIQQAVDFLLRRWVEGAARISAAISVAA